MKKVIRCNHIVGEYGYVCGNVIGIVEDGKKLVVSKHGRTVCIPLHSEDPVTVKCECCNGLTRVYKDEN